MTMKKIFLAALAAAALSSCSDDNEPLASTDVPMQVSTSIRTEGRALIEGDAFPTGQTIAVSLFDGATGGAYEGKTDGFVNIPYTSSADGTGGAVVWSSTTPIHLSPAEGKAIAWYPHSAYVTDHQTIPVETATQTDYMYSDWATGISAISPQASFTMHHALAAIDVHVTKGDYQIGDARLTSFSVQSAGFGTSATLNADGGALTGIQGQNTPLSHTPDALITPTGTSFPVLVVPDQSVAQPTIKVSLEIDGKRYVKDIVMQEAFQQGRRYLYKFKLNDTKLDVMSVTIVEWNTETKPQGELKPGKAYAHDEYVVKIKIPSDGYTFKSNVCGFTGVIDWGDGETSTLSRAYNPSHVYKTKGEYFVTAKGKCSLLSSGISGGNATSSCILDILYIGGRMGINDMSCSFYGSSKLKYLRKGIFDQLTEVTSFSHAFVGCSGLTGIPQGLFDHCTKVTSFYGTFDRCGGVTSIPQGLFDQCIQVENFEWTFRECKALTSIPVGLFDKCTQVTNFGATFSGCSGVQSIPQGLFDQCIQVTNFGYTFSGCNGLTGIPQGLFDQCTQVTSFQETFYGCSSLQSIPQGLFDQCTQVTSFWGTFKGCSGLQSIPQGLFDHCTKVTRFEGTFEGCSGLRSIPQGLFDKCTQVTDFEGVFRECKALTSIPVGLFDKNVNVTSFGHTFRGCSGLQSIPQGLFDNCTKVTNFEYTFSECSGLTSIPQGLFDNNRQVTDFYRTFRGCSGLRSIPQGLFDKCTQVTSFRGTFKGCSGLTGESPYTEINGIKVHLYERSNYSDRFKAPTLYSYCFNDCTNLSDYAQIPSSWK